MNVTDIFSMFYKYFISLCFWYLCFWLYTRLVVRAISIRLYATESKVPYIRLCILKQQSCLKEPSPTVGITVEFSTCMKHIKLYIKLKVFLREIQICNLFGHTLFHWRVMALQSWTLQ